MTETSALTKTAFADYVNKSWEALRDLHACDNMTRNDFHFIDYPEDDYLVMGVHYNGDNSCWFDVYFLNGSVSKVAQYDSDGDMIGYIYDSTND